LIFSIGFAQNGIIINNGAKVELNNGATLVIGDDMGFINNSTETVLNGSVIFSGTALQEIGGTESSQFTILEIDNLNGVYLAVDTRVADQLILSSGVLDLGDFNLTMSDIADVSGTFSSDNMIAVDGNGRLIKEISGNGGFLLPVGDLTAGADYSPVEFDFLSGNYSNANISLGVSNSKHVDNPSANDYLNRYWLLNSSGITGFSCDLIFNYVSGDIVGTESNIIGAVWDAGSWTKIGQAGANQFSGSTEHFDSVTGLESQYVDVFNIAEEQLLVYYDKGNIFLKSEDPLNIESVEVYDMVGQLIQSKSPINDGYDEIPFSASSGYYLLKINTDRGSFAKKLLIN
jgi:hypothetical protein